MKKLFISLLLVFIVSSSLPILGQTPKNEEKPRLIVTSENEKRAERIEIITSCVKDTMRISLKVVVRFDKVFSDSVNLTNPSQVYLYYIENIGEKKITLSRFDKGRRTRKQNCIWNACEEQFKIWMQDQPYSKMPGIERYYGVNGIAFGYHVYLIPEKSIKNK